MSSSTGRPYTFDPYATGSRTAGPDSTGPDSTGSSRTISSSRRSSTTGTAKDQAASVASDAAQAGQRVAGTAKDQASDVVGEAKTQAKGLLGQTRTQLSEQTTAGQQRAATGLGALAAELKDLAEGKGGDGVATDLAHQASQRLDAVASWLGDREPADLLRDVQAFARRRPVAFLAIAAGAGLLAGRLTRGIAAASHDDGATTNPTAAPATMPSTSTADTDTARITDTSYGAAPTRSTDSLSTDQGWDARR